MGTTFESGQAPSIQQLDQFQKSGYASEFFYVIALALAKSAGFWLVKLLAPISWLSISVWVGLTVNIVWVVVAIFGIAFQCGVTDSWAIISGHCIDQVSKNSDSHKKLVIDHIDTIYMLIHLQTAFWIFIGIVDILVDILLIVLPTCIFWTLQIPRGTKFAVWFVFSARLLVIPITILRLVFLTNESHSRTVQPLGRSFHSAMATEFQLHIAIIAACAPFLKTFIESMQHGFTTADLFHAPAVVFSGAQKTGKSGYILSSLGKTGMTVIPDMPRRNKRHTSTSESMRHLAEMPLPLSDVALPHKIGAVNTTTAWAEEPASQVHDANGNVLGDHDILVERTIMTGQEDRYS